VNILARVINIGSDFSERIGERERKRERRGEEEREGGGGERERERERKSYHDVDCNKLVAIIIEDE